MLAGLSYTLSYLSIIVKDTDVSRYIMSLGSLHCSSVLSLFLLLTTIMRAFCVPSDATSFQYTDLKNISKSYMSEAFIVRVNYTFKGGSYY